MTGSSTAVRFLIGGKVQGVFYRAATAEQAERLGLRGWAKNLDDGRVEVVASGPADAVAELAAWLWQGPPAARVTSVTVEEWTDVLPDDGFRVRR